jgi:dihydrofolate reductase
MVYWETAHTTPGRRSVSLEYARIWQAADKVVYSTALNEVASARTRIKRTFDPEAVRQLKADSDLALSVNGPDLAAQAIRAGLVDEYQLFVKPAIVGGGNPFFPDDVRVDLELLDERRFGNGVVYLRYGVEDYGQRG